MAPLGSESGCDRAAGIRVFEDKEFQRWMLRVSLAVVVAGAAVGGAWAIGFGGLADLDRFEGAFGDAGIFVALAVLIVSFCLHEAVHALFFRLYAPSGSRVYFGANWKAGMIYACAEGIVFSRRRYQIALIAPTIAVTAALMVIGAISGCALVMWAIAVLHLSGCAGDWGYLIEIARDRTIDRCEDTSWGVRFLRAGEPDPSRGEDAR